MRRCRSYLSSRSTASRDVHRASRRFDHVEKSYRRAAQLHTMSKRDEATMASTTEEVLERHVKCFFEGDLEGIVSDYSADAVLFTPSGPLKGHDPIREFFRALMKEFGQPGTTFSMQLQSIDGEFAYALWSAETADNVYEMATDTHVVRDGKIVAQSFAGQIKPKR